MKTAQRTPRREPVTNSGISGHVHRNTQGGQFSSGFVEINPNSKIPALVADIAIWPCYRALAKGRLYDAAEFLQVHEYRHVRRWADEINARPAAKRGRMVNRTWGPPEEQLHERHDRGDFTHRTEDELEVADC